MKVAIAHMLMKLRSKKVNFERVKNSVREAKERGAHVVVLPASFNVGSFQTFYPVSQAREIAVNLAEKIPGGQSSSFLSKLAASCDIYILSGPILERAGPRLFLTSFLVDPSGVVKGRYRKIGLDVLDRAIGVSPGRATNVVSLKGDIGLLLEHDIAYPEIARAVVLQGAGALLGFARVGELGEKRLEKIAETRSYENGVPLLVVGGAMESAERVFAETPSLVVDPKDGILERITLSDLGEKAEYAVSVVELRLANYTRVGDLAELLDIIALLYKSSKRVAREKGQSRGRDSNPR